MKGTIYYDESSRGYHQNEGRTPYKRGRWVGERMEYGRRVRMRSTDYNKVLQWVENGTVAKTLPRIKDFPHHTVDVKNRVVYNKWGKAMKGRLLDGDQVYKLCYQGNKFEARFNRIAYAVLHDIGVTQMPDTICVNYKDGEYTLQHKGDKLIEKTERRKAHNRKFISNSLAKRKRETEILQRFYQSGDQTELVKYVSVDIFDCLVSRIRAVRHCRLDRAVEVVLAGTEKYLDRATSRGVPYVTISSSIVAICRHEIKEEFKFCHDLPRIAT